MIFSSVSFSKSRDRRDFGRGFYTTTIREQAEQWAGSLYKRYGGDGKFLYIFEFDQADVLLYKKFDGLTLDWLETVKNNRHHGGLQHQFDVVTGPVANDNTMPLIALHVGGIISAEAALVQLAHFKTNNQVSFHTEKALAYLHFVERISL
jgi:hypothetical protein